MLQVPTPCYAVLLLFPSGTQSEFKAEEAAKLAETPQVGRRWLLPDDAPGGRVLCHSTALARR